MDKIAVAVLVSGGGTNLQAILDAERRGELPHANAGAEIIVLAGFMSILSGRFTSRYPERIINVHPSLIPKFCGKGFYGLKVHEAVLAAGEKTTGATVHYVNEIPDGGRIIFQKEVAVKEGDTPESLQKRVMQEAEWQLLPRAVELTAERIAAERSAK